MSRKPTSSSLDFDDDLDSLLGSSEGPAPTKTLPAAKTAMKTTASTAKTPAGAADDMDDYMDIEDLLQNLESSKPSAAKSLGGTYNVSKPAGVDSPQKKSANGKDIADFLPTTKSSGTSTPGPGKSTSDTSARQELERPPTRSGQKPTNLDTKKKSGGDDLFDDDDVLGSMGLDSPRPETHKLGLASTLDTDTGRGARSVLDDLLGKSKSSTTERPSSSGGDPFDAFTSNLKRSSTSEPKKDEDTAYGGYKPSTASNSRPSSKRSVRFENDDRRPSSQPSGKSRDSLFDTEDADWLDMAAGPSDGKQSKTLDRPRSEGSAADKPPPGKLSQTQAPAATDWLGFSRIGSPDTTPRTQEELSSPPPVRGASLAKELGMPTSKSSKDVGDGSGRPSFGSQSSANILRTDQDSMRRDSMRGGNPQSPSDWLGLGNDDDDDFGKPGKMADKNVQRKGGLGDQASANVNILRTDGDGLRRGSQSGANFDDPSDWLGLGKDDDDFAGLAGKTADRKERRKAVVEGLTDQPAASANVLRNSGSFARRDSLNGASRDDSVDWLGLGNEEEMGATGKMADRRNQRKGFDEGSGDDFLGLGAPRSSKSGSQMERGQKISNDDLFPSTPLTSKPSASSVRKPSRLSDDELFRDPDRKPSRTTEDGFLRDADRRVSRPTDEDFLRDVDRKVPPKSADGDFLHDMERKPSRPTDDNLFGKPSRQSMSASLPWDMDLHPAAPGAEEQKGKVVPVAADSSSRMESFQPPVTSTPAAAAPSAVITPAGVSELQLRIQEEMEQQRKQQMELQRRLQEQQEQRRQRDEQLRLMQQQMQSMGSGMADIFGGGLLEELDSRIRHLEAEKQFLEKTLELTKQQFEQERKMIEESYQKQLQLNEETFGKREARLRQENELMSEQLLEKLKLVEKEKSELFSMHLRKQTGVDTDRNSEIERLKENHRVVIDELHREHQLALERVMKAKEAELDAVANSRDHSKTLGLAIQKMQDNTLDLHELQSRVDFKHSSVLSEREAAASARDESLRMLQDRLERQQQSNEMERARLQGLITKLELQLTDQTRELEQEKWRVRQEENGLKSAQSSLEQERLRLIEQSQRDRLELDRLKEKFLADQQASLAELNEERMTLAKERAEFNVEQRLKNDMLHRSTAKSQQGEVEVEAAMRALSDERSRLSAWKHELELAAEKAHTDADALEQRRRLADVEKRKLEQLAQQLHESSAAVDELVTNATAAQHDGQRALASAKQIEAEHNNRLARIHSDLQALHAKQKQIAEERLSLAREKSSLNDTKNAAVCIVCRTPIRDVSADQQLQPSSAVVYREDAKHAFNPPAQYPPAQYPPARYPSDAMPAAAGTSYQSAPLSRIYEAIQQDRTVRMWRIAANRDKDFLEEESYFLEAVKHAPYHSSAGAI